MPTQKDEGAYLKRTITFLVSQNLGDRFLNYQECDFKKTEDGSIMVVEDKGGEKISS